jgi:arylsulfatase A-like enzyme
MVNIVTKDIIVKPLLPASILALLASQAFIWEKDPVRPNLVFVFPDQMRASCQGFLGEEPVMTPNIDRFAGQGLVLGQAVSNAPVCSPYRAMLMTGMYPVSNGVVTNCTSRAGEFGIELKKEARSWSDILHDKDYSLGYIGKWHLDAPHAPYIPSSNNEGALKWNEWTSPERRHGFDFWYAYGTYDQHLRPMYWTTGAPRDSFRYVDQWGPEHEADMAIRYITNEGGSYRAKNKPFALVVSMNPPHMPYNQVPGRYISLYDPKAEEIESMFSHPAVPDTSDQMGRYFRQHIRNQLAMVTGVDEQFGRILAALKKSGLDKNTIVIFTSDHGDCLGKHGQISKSNPFEESMHVPFIIRWTGRIRPGREDLLFSTPDIYPTLLGLMGFAEEIPETVEGTNFAGLFTGKEKTERPSSQLYFMTDGQLFSSPAGTGKLNLESGERGVRTERYTLSIMRRANSRTSTFLWDRQEDPMQMNNIAADHPEIVKELVEKELLPWLTLTRDPWLR